MTTLQHTTLPVGLWQVDRAHSTVGFEVRDMTNLVATIHGRFTDYDAVLDVTPEAARASATIRVASLTTDHEQRDEDLRSEQFLGACAHPEIRFESDSIDVDDEGAVAVRGRLELKGSEHPVALDGHVLGTGRDHSGTERLAIAAAGDFPFGPMTVRLVLDVSATTSS